MKSIHLVRLMMFFIVAIACQASAVVGEVTVTNGQDVDVATQTVASVAILIDKEIKQAEEAMNKARERLFLLKDEKPIPEPGHDIPDLPAAIIAEIIKEKNVFIVTKKQQLEKLTKVEKLTKEEKDKTWTLQEGYFGKAASVIANAFQFGPSQDQRKIAQDIINGLEKQKKELKTEYELLTRYKESGLTVNQKVESKKRYDLCIALLDAEIYNQRLITGEVMSTQKKVIIGAVLGGTALVAAGLLLANKLFMPEAPQGFLQEPKENTITSVNQTPKNLPLIQQNLEKEEHGINKQQEELQWVQEKEQYVQQKLEREQQAQAALEQEARLAAEHKQEEAIKNAVAEQARLMAQQQADVAIAEKAKTREQEKEFMLMEDQYMQEQEALAAAEQARLMAQQQADVAIAEKAKAREQDKAFMLMEDQYMQEQEDLAAAEQERFKAIAGPPELAKEDRENDSAEQRLDESIIEKNIHEKNSTPEENGEKFVQKLEKVMDKDYLESLTNSDLEHIWEKAKSRREQLINEKNGPELFKVSNELDMIESVMEARGFWR
ncbi:MAG TPA: hypothetical protein VLB80_02260 [Candidatus Babeliales bacterium]|nr:hypothetical protein [Candidatus Babeliales bacterium]